MSMTFEQFASVIRTLVNDGLAPAQIRSAAFDIIGPGADAALALVAERDLVVREAMATIAQPQSGPAPTSSRDEVSKRREPASGEVIPPNAGARRNVNGGASRARGIEPPEVKHARALLRQELRDGPRPGAEIEAAAQAANIPKAALIAATDELGVRTKHRATAPKSAVAALGTKNIQKSDKPISAGRPSFEARFARTSG
jgi:hypothetical protein